MRTVTVTGPRIEHCTRCRHTKRDVRRPFAVKGRFSGIPVIQALQTLSSVAEVIATFLVAEVGKFRRFHNPKQLMAYAGLVPSEFSSGSRKQGRITKAGNAHLRRVLGEAAWS